MICMRHCTIYLLIAVFFLCAGCCVLVCINNPWGCIDYLLVCIRIFPWGCLLCFLMSSPLILPTISNGLLIESKSWSIPMSMISLTSSSINSSYVSSMSYGGVWLYHVGFLKKIDSFLLFLLIVWACTHFCLLVVLLIFESVYSIVPFHLFDLLSRFPFLLLLYSIRLTFPR